MPNILPHKKITKNVTFLLVFKICTVSMDVLYPNFYSFTSVPSKPLDRRVRRQSLTIDDDAFKLAKHRSPFFENQNNLLNVSKQCRRSTSLHPFQETSDLKDKHLKLDDNNQYFRNSTPSPPAAFADNQINYTKTFNRKNVRLNYRFDTNLNINLNNISYSNTLKNVNHKKESVGLKSAVSLQSLNQINYQVKELKSNDIFMTSPILSKRSNLLKQTTFVKSYMNDPIYHGRINSTPINSFANINEPDIQSNSSSIHPKLFRKPQFKPDFEYIRQQKNRKSFDIDDVNISSLNSSKYIKHRNSSTFVDFCSTDSGIELNETNKIKIENQLPSLDLSIYKERLNKPLRLRRVCI